MRGAVEQRPGSTRHAIVATNNLLSRPGPKKPKISQTYLNKPKLLLKQKNPKEILHEILL